MNNKAILIVSYGALQDDVREKTIDAFLKDVKALYPNYITEIAFTGGMIIRGLAKRGVIVHSVATAMKSLFEKGITELVIQPLHFLFGDDYDNVHKVVKENQELFKKISVSTPLMGSTQDYVEVIDAIINVFEPSENECLVLMGHGTKHYSNASYAALGYMLRKATSKNILVGALEAYPDIEVILDELKVISPKKVKLIPFLLIAGTHAKKDMVGEHDESWKNRIEKAGFEVEPIVIGMGEVEMIRKIFLRHLKETIEALD